MTLPKYKLRRLADRHYAVEVAGEQVGAVGFLFRGEWKWVHFGTGKKSYSASKDAAVANVLNHSIAEVR